MEEIHELRFKQVNQGKSVCIASALHEELEIISVNGQKVNILGFVGNMVSVAIRSSDIAQKQLYRDNS